MPELDCDGERLEELLARLVEETISPDEFEELDALLDGDVDAQRRYLHYLGLHADLQEPGLLAADARAGSRLSRLSMRSPAAIVAALVFATLVVVGVLISRPEPVAPDIAGSSSEPIARIVELNGSVAWTGNGGEFRHDLEVGAPLTGGTLETLAQKSWAEIEFMDGSRIWVSGLSVLTLSEGDGGKLVRLRHGELSVDVRPQPADTPFRLETASAAVEVLGTKFNLTSDPYTTSVTVNEGSVRVRRLADGEVRDVPADHRVVAALERGVEFEVHPRRRYSEEWTSELPRDLRYGEFRPDGSRPSGAVLARPLLWREIPDRPILLHVASLRPSEDAVPRVRLGEGAQIRIEGRLDRDHPVVFGLTTLHGDGGFAGKYSKLQKISTGGDTSGAFQVTFPLSELKPERECFPESLVGHELFDCWILTIENDAGLEITKVEIFN